MFLIFCSCRFCHTRRQDYSIQSYMMKETILLFSIHCVNNLASTILWKHKTWSLRILRKKNVVFTFTKSRAFAVFPSYVLNAYSKIRVTRSFLITAFFQSSKRIQNQHLNRVMPSRKYSWQTCNRATQNQYIYIILRMFVLYNHYQAR